MAELTNQQKMDMISSYLNSVRGLGALNSAIPRYQDLRIVMKPVPMLLCGNLKIQLSPEAATMLGKGISDTLVKMTDTFIAEANRLLGEVHRSGSLAGTEKAEAAETPAAPPP